MSMKGTLKIKSRRLPSQKTKLRTAGLWIDHREAVIVLVSPEGEVTKKIRSDAEKHAGRIDGVRSTTSYESKQVPADDRRQSSFMGHLNSYYDEVIACIRDAESILIFGPGEAKGELKKRIERDKSSKRIAGVETVDKMTDRQIAAKVREYFQKENGHEKSNLGGRRQNGFAVRVIETCPIGSVETVLPVANGCRPNKCGAAIAVHC